MVIQKKLRQYLIKIYSKTHQIAPFKKDNYRESMPRTPLTKCMVSKSEKIKKLIIGPPLAKSWQILVINGHFGCVENVCDASKNIEI